MCWRCSSLPGEPGLSRRGFGLGALAAVALPLSCLPSGADDIVEPAMSLIVPAGPRIVALTLDACSGAVDMRIVDVMLHLSIPATIFVTALWLHSNTAALALMRARADLFTLQNHGELHLPPVLGARRVYGLRVAGDLDTVHREVTHGADEVAATGSARPRWYRGAAGLYSPAAIAAIVGAGSGIAAYSLNADEGASLPAASVTRRIAAARSGDVIVAHINQPHRPSGAGVAAGIAELQQSGTVFTGLDAFPMTAIACHPHAIGRHMV
jgi:peptidoglycan/xylan/chitin deacetylase (PgdA/CDA1 family)